MSSTLFLTGTELAQLTGWKLKSRQIAWLRTEGIPFRVSATGHAVVTWAAVEGRQAAAQAEPVTGWTPRVLAQG